jgi:hypothetical protein
MLTSFNAIGQNKINNGSSSIEVRKIWDKAPYNAFTDLIRFKGKFYCTFREGSGHVPGKNGTNGEIRILSSKTGKHWNSIALLKKEGVDLRDPKISIAPNGHLMVICGGSVYKGDSLLARFPQVSYSDANGSNFSAPEKINIDHNISNNYDWIWRVTWYNNIGYGIDYQIGPKERHGPTQLFLVSTKNGKDYKFVHQFHIDGFPNESTIRFGRNGKMYVLIRRDLGDTRGLLAVSNPPFTNWTFNKLPIRLGGPNFIFLNNNQLIIGSRLNEKAKPTVTHTGILLTNLNGEIDTTILLPSGNDTGYPGLCLYKNTLWVSYYSNQKNNHHTSIYLAEIPLNVFKKGQ